MAKTSVDVASAKKYEKQTFEFERRQAETQVTAL